MEEDIEYGMNLPLSNKQIEALRVIANEENGNEPQDLDTVLSRLTYKTTKPSFQFTVRSLIKRGLIEKRSCETLRKKSRRFLAVTELGRHKLSAETYRASKPADPKTCGFDEVEKTDRLIAEIFAKFKVEET